MRYNLMLSVLVFCASMAFAQDGILSGKVMGPTLCEFIIKNL